MCRHFKETNIFPGGFSEKVFVSEEHLKNVAYLKPENLTNEEASFYEPLGCCIRAVRRAALKENSTALVIGLGSIGILMAQALKAFGMNVIGCDLISSRVQTLKNLGIEAFVLSEMCDSIKADGIFMTSGSDKAIETALKYVRDGGKILVFSSTPQNFGYANNEIYYRELTVLGSYSPSPKDLNDSLKLLKSKEVKVQGLSTNYPLEKIQKAIENTLDNKILKAYISINNI
jgi:L-iditol 2-dehydrogenase